MHVSRRCTVFYLLFFSFIFGALPRNVRRGSKFTIGCRSRRWILIQWTQKLIQVWLMKTVHKIIKCMKVYKIHFEFHKWTHSNRGVDGGGACVLGCGDGEGDTVGSGACCLPPNIILYCTEWVSARICLRLPCWQEAQSVISYTPPSIHPKYFQRKPNTLLSDHMSPSRAEWCTLHIAQKRAAYIGRQETSFLLCRLPQLVHLNKYKIIITG